VRVQDSRRLTGPSLLLDTPGAILDVALQGLDPQVAIEAWRAELLPLLEAVGWAGAPIAARSHRQGITLAFGAPIDALYAATEVNEAAWHAAALRLGGEPLNDPHEAPRGDEFGDGRGDADEPEDREDVAARLRAAIERESSPELLRVAAEAGPRHVTMLADDRRVSVGLGTGSRSWPREETAAALERIRWSELHDVPVALVTGTNGKTTTVRLLGAMARAAGLTAGVTSTDRVTVGDEIVAVGDYSGPNGARTVLRDRRVEIAMLEVARGGILRRGLGVPCAAAALVTNVAEDHLGEFGIFDLEALADAKLVVAKAVGAEGRLILNADDPLLLDRGTRRLPSLERAPHLIWFTLDPQHEAVATHVSAGGEACWVEEGEFVQVGGGRRTPIARVTEVPLTFDGSARHNVANALAALGVAMALELPAGAQRDALLEFESTPALNPGRANRWQLGGVTVIVDYAHNPHGLEALAQLVAGIRARRRALVIGQAGDRDDESIRALARTAWTMRPDRVFIKEMASFLRGRERGVVTGLIEDELRRRGASADSLVRCDSELEAVRAALVWSREADLLLLTIHAQRDEVIALLDRLAARGWKPGDSLEPAASPAR
jgi:UDP-N-acetylmuramyl tripeptide synthase